MESNDFQSLTKLGANSSPIADDLLALIPNSNQRAVSPPSDLLTLSDDGRMVAIRVTAHDVGQVTPSLKELGFEVLGSAPELHFIEGWMPIRTLAKVFCDIMEGQTFLLEKTKFKNEILES